MSDLMLVVISAFLWAIYSVLKNCLAELKQIQARADVTNGLLVSISDHAEMLRSNVRDLHVDVHAIETATAAFHEQMQRANSRY